MIMSNTSNNHVGELLKKLEELKRKKAHKERKLMKIKSSYPPNVPKVKTSTSGSRMLSAKNSDSTIEVGNSEKYCGKTVAEERVFCSESSSNANKNGHILCEKFVSVPGSDLWSSHLSASKSNVNIKNTLTFKENIENETFSPVVLENGDKVLKSQSTKLDIHSIKQFFHENDQHIVEGPLPSATSTATSNSQNNIKERESTKSSIKFSGVSQDDFLKPGSLIGSGDILAKSPDKRGRTTHFDPARLDPILRKDLSCFLDAHYGSPTKDSVSKSDAFSFENCSSVPFSKIASFSEHASDDEPMVEMSNEVLVGRGCGSLDFQNFPVKDPVAVMDEYSNINSQVKETLYRSIEKVCANVSHPPDLLSSISGSDINDSLPDSEILVIPETEGLGLKVDDDACETSTINKTMDCVYSVNSSKCEKSSLNKAVTSDEFDNFIGKKSNLRELSSKEQFSSILKQQKMAAEIWAASVPHDSSAIDVPFLEEDTQELGKLKHVPYMNEEDIFTDSIKTVDYKSNLNLTCTLQGAVNELVLDAEIISFNDVKYAFIQHRKQIHVWCLDKAKWVKIFCHEIDVQFSFEKMCFSTDDSHLVTVMLLQSDTRHCLQFLLFEKNEKVIKLMENTHWLEERSGSVLLCGLEGLMFATAQHTEVSLHAFISLKETPRLMTVVLGSTDEVLGNLCKISNLPNALMGVGSSMLYIWHILEARLVTAVSLHPPDFLPIRSSFWATVENGLIYFLTTCDGAKEFQVCQLLAANLATGFCHSAMSYSTVPSQMTKAIKIVKAVYLEPFLAVAHSKGVLLWSVSEEFCCASLPSQSQISTVTVSKDIENWGTIAVGGKSGCLHCYTLMGID